MENEIVYLDIGAAKIKEGEVYEIPIHGVTETALEEEVAAIEETGRRIRESFPDDYQELTDAVVEINRVLPGKYKLPEGGIPETDLNEAVREKLNSSGTPSDYDTVKRNLAEQTEINRQQSRDILNLKAAAEGKLYRVEEDTAEAYSKSVPVDALPGASLDMFGGNSVVWNQLLYNSGVVTPYGVRFETNNGIIHATGKFTTANGQYRITSQPKNSVLNHVYAHTVKTISGQPNGTWAFTLLGKRDFPINELAIRTASADGVELTPVLIMSNVSTDDDIDWYLRSYLVDLTKMFGAGNEPTDTSDPRIAMIEAYVESHPTYNVGAIISADVESVDIADNGGNVTDSKQVPAAIRALPGYGWSAGSVYNAVNLETKQYIQRVGSVDLGTLNWEVINLTLGRIRTRENSLNMAIVLSGSGNIACEKFIAISGAAFYQNTAKGIAVNNGNLGPIEQRDIISISDDMFINVTSNEAKSLLSATILYYELAEPIVTDISNLIPDGFADLTVEAGGGITFKQSELELPVPNKETYLIKVGGNA